MEQGETVATSPLRAPSLETPRLLLRRWHSDDLDGFAAVNAQPEVMRYIHDGRTLDRAATAERLATYQRHWDERGFGLYAVEIKETGWACRWSAKPCSRTPAVRSGSTRWTCERIVVSRTRPPTHGPARPVEPSRSPR
ncbi:GNAT family N-acetyltransferase [Micromonospora orduensis]|uniref:GNAT family N-acetyltransferase n=1 Tax=Micromonospora orduensis TaxID=1420891 RepID=UPI001FCCB877|nr:GNAT family N-acetyltransferase [Micromonospora orduensis]